MIARAATLEPETTRAARVHRARAPRRRIASPSPEVEGSPAEAADAPGPRPLLWRQAVAMLVHDRAKLIGMVFGLAFSALLMTQQMGVFLGVLELSRHTVDASRADLWVGDPHAVMTTYGAPLRPADVARVASVEGVAWASAFTVRPELAWRRDGSYEQCQLFAVDPRTLAGAPLAMLAGRVEDLRRPDAVILDAEAVDHLASGAGAARARYAVGDVVVVGERRMTVVGIARTQRNFQFQPALWTASVAGADAGRRPYGFVLAGARPGEDHERLAAAVSRATGLRAMTSAAFSDENFSFLLYNTGIPANFAIAVGLGFIVGLAIAGQTFLQFVNDHLRHFAALRALGATRRTIMAMVAAQALVAGALGYGIGVGLAALFDRAVHGTILASRLAPGLLLATAGATAVIVLLAAAVGGWRATRADPASVFRS
jgi:putative ABC transport system permease protein